MRLLFVINPVSGGKKKADHETLIKKFFSGRQETIEIVPLKTPDLNKYVRKWKPDRVIAVGGDGTVKLVAEIVLNSKIPMGIIPAGSANGMAVELGLPTDFEGTMNVVLNGQIKVIDAIQINRKELCIHLGDLGLNALLVKNFEQTGIRGKVGYALSAVKTLWQRQAIQVEISNKKMSMTLSGFMIVLANARKYGTGVNINPDGDLSDGLFELVIIRRLSLVELLKMVKRFRPFDPRKTEIIQAEKVSIKCRRRAHFQLDGEYMGKVSEVKAAVLPRALHVLVSAV